MIEVDYKEAARRGNSLISRHRQISEGRPLQQDDAEMREVLLSLICACDERGIDWAEAVENAEQDHEELVGDLRCELAPS